MLYGAARATGSRTANRDPTTRVVGYMERRIASRYVGMKGDLRAAIFGIFEGVEGGPFVVLGVEGGESFWMRAERRGVVDGESICRCYNIWWKSVECFANVLQLGANGEVMWKPDCWRQRGNNFSVGAWMR